MKIRRMGRIRRPTTDEIIQLAKIDYLHLSKDEADKFVIAAEGILNHLDRLDDIPEKPLPIKYTSRDRGYSPSEDEDPFNIFVTKCLVRGANKGKLLGKKVGIKDNISVQGIPMTNASRLSETYIPNIDATVVTRLLDEGAVIVGKLNMDDLSKAGTSETSIFGAVRNPINPEYSPGGSSSGSGAALANGDVDIAIGVDQMGSARIPACWCGVLSIKATHGLVPSFGIAYQDHTLDHVCPMATNAMDLALTLEVIAGDDPNDPQWVRGPIKVSRYSKQIKNDVKGLKFGLIKESINWPNSEADVVEAVIDASKDLRKVGVSCQEVSVPFFKDALSIWSSIILHSSSAMMESGGEGYWRKGWYNTYWNKYFGNAREARSDDLPPRIKLGIIMGRYMRTKYHSIYHSKAQNLRIMLTEAVEDAFTKYDVLVTPTTVIKPPKLDQKANEIDVHRVPGGINTCPFNLTGHPAITVPCATRKGLPVGIQFIGPYYSEGLLLRIAYTFEKNFDWKSA